MRFYYGNGSVFEGAWEKAPSWDLGGLHDYLNGH